MSHSRWRFSQGQRASWVTILQILFLLLLWHGDKSIALANPTKFPLYEPLKHSEKEVSKKADSIDKPHIMEWFLKTSKTSSNDNLEFRGICEKITIDFCQDRWYNQTMYPNMFQHHSQLEAKKELSRFQPLIDSNCSHELRFFLCSTHVPICLTNYKHALLPCRPVCERVKANCEPFMLKFNHQWPSTFDCDQFPMENNHKNELCMDTKASFQNNNEIQHGRLLPDEMKLRENGKIPLGNDDLAYIFSPNADYREDQEEDDYEFWDHLNIGNASDKCHCECSPPFIQVNDPKSIFFNKVKTGFHLNCLPSCHHPLLYPDAKVVVQRNKLIIHNWIKVWTLLQIFASMFNILVILFILLKKIIEKGAKIMSTNGTVYSYQRPNQLQVCHFFILLIFLYRLSVGHEKIACINTLLPSKSITMNNANWTNSQCAIVFLILYYSTMASYTWWIVDALKRCLFLVQEWNLERHQLFSKLVSSLAWILPLVQVITAFSVSAIESDTMAGLCFVPSTSVHAHSNKKGTENIIALVIGPMAIYLIAGWSIFAFILWNKVKTQRKCISTYSLWYIFCSGLLKTILWISFIIEYRNSNSWLVNALCNQCPSKQVGVVSLMNFFKAKYAVWIMFGIFDMITSLDEYRHMSRDSDMTNKSVADQFSLAYMTSSIKNIKYPTDSTTTLQTATNSNSSCQDSHLDQEQTYSSMQKLIYTPQMYPKNSQYQYFK